MSRTSDQRLADILERISAIGEAVKSLPADITARHQDIPWSDIAKMRDILAHIYFNVRSDVIRSTINAPLAALRDVCEAEMT